MKIANHTVRSSSPYVYKYIDSTQYQFTSATYVPKSKAYSLANKAVAGKIELNKSLRGMEVQEDSSVRYYKI